MTQQDPQVGAIPWIDLTVPNATAVRDFYQSVVGWKSGAVDMGGYSDYTMINAKGDTVAGVCHARGINADLPPQWIIYVVVADVDASTKRCAKLGGEVVVEPRAMGGGRFAVIRDPAGAVCGLYHPGK